jgi:hypothetical protein
MNRTGRTIVLGGVVMLVLGTDWALEKAFTSYRLDGAGVSEPAAPSDGVASPLACDPADMPAAFDSSPAKDRRSQA